MLEHRKPRRCGQGYRSALQLRAIAFVYTDSFGLIPDWSRREDSGLHEAGSAEGRSAEAQRSRNVDPRRVSYEVNEPDAFALEEALRQKEKHTGEVVVVTAGPARASQALREALAKGADRAIHLEDDGFVALDAYNTARAIAAAVKDDKFDLIFTGLQSDDYGYAQTGVILAQILGLPHATIIMQIEKTDAGIRVKRELEAGFFQFVDIPLPAVLTIQSGINKLRWRR